MGKLIGSVCLIGSLFIIGQNIYAIATFSVTSPLLAAIIIPLNIVLVSFWMSLAITELHK